MKDDAFSVLAQRLPPQRAGAHPRTMSRQRFSGKANT